MSLEREVIQQLRRTAPAGRHTARNLEMVLFFYGFGEAPWPTLDMTAKTFALGSRERVRQILRTAFPDRLPDDALPRIRAAAEALRSRPLWISSDLRSAMGLKTTCRPSAPGLLSLLHHLGLIDGYEIFDLSLTPLTRSLAGAQADGVIARPAAVPAVRTALQETRRLGRRAGIANTGHLDRAGFDEPTRSFLKRLLAADPTYWTARDLDGELWYAPEDPSNVLVQLAAKVFAVTPAIPRRRLADGLTNALRGRSRLRPRPDLAVVEAWIKGSSFFGRGAEGVVFLGSAAELTPLEHELIDYFSARRSSDFKGLKDHLVARGVAASQIGKAATLSPVIHVDRSEGMRSFRYSLIGGPA